MKFMVMMEGVPISLGILFIQKPEKQREKNMYSVAALLTSSV